MSPSSYEQLEGVESLLVSLWAVLCFCTLGGVETEGISTAWDLIIKNKKLQMLTWFCMVWRTQNVGFLGRLPKTPLLPLRTDVKLVLSRGQWHVGCETHLRPYKRQGRESLCHESRPPRPPPLAAGGAHISKASPLHRVLLPSTFLGWVWWDGLSGSFLGKKTCCRPFSVMLSRLNFLTCPLGRLVIREGLVGVRLGELRGPGGLQVPFGFKGSWKGFTSTPGGFHWEQLCY